MEDHVSRIQYQDKELILIATAHVSKQSVELVKRVISEEQPDSICIELDEERYKNIQNPKAWESMDIVQVIKTKKVGFLLANLVLSSYQKKMAKKLDTAVGQEMIQGIQSANEIGAQLVLADRNIQTTFMRIWRKLGLLGKLKLLFTLLFSFDEGGDISDEDLNKLLQDDILESMMADMRKQFPRIAEVLINERDQHLASKIKEAPGRKVVAILGGAHVPGVKAEIFKSQDLAKITEVPPPSPFSKIFGWSIPAIVLGFIVYGFVVSFQTGLEQITTWILWNSSMAALFTAFALGHPLSVITSFLVAPISALNPVLACGWFTGLVEASRRKPTVSDVNSIPVDILSFKGFFKNRFLRILLIVVMANLGSVIGTFIAGIDIIHNIF
ncbi:MAG: TraB/GumN family protein [Vallitaleaceae bacterium]|nr:TraB/GumN family protein [Vallitaleaceae bacterium]